MFKTALLLACIEFVRSKSMEGFIVGGQDVDIVSSSHSAYITIQIGALVSACGASILNQNIVITAAHCFEDFTRHSKVTVRAGNSNKMQGSVRRVNRVSVHYMYDRTNIENDIALAYFKKSLPLGSHIKRVVIMKDPPKTKMGYVAGWGIVDDIRHQGTVLLKRVKQPLWSREECKKVLRKVPQGILCGGGLNWKEYAAEGDSGSALVINDYIQIGLVSFKRPEISNSVVVYTDLSFFYKWIVNAAKKIRCN